MIVELCEKCGFNMNGSDVITAQQYSLDCKFLFDETGSINTSAFSDYIIFVCHKCGNTKKLFFSDILKKEKETILELVTALRTEQCSKTSRAITIDEDNAISYCGICPGFCDGDGYCFNDAIRDCKFRRQILES